MKPNPIRKTVRTLYESGKRKKEIARFLKIDIKTVRAILAEESGETKSRSDKILVDYDVLKALHERCDGYAQRMHEVLTEEHKIPIGCGERLFERGAFFHLTDIRPADAVPYYEIR